jgi:hypothetical protein
LPAKDGTNRGGYRVGAGRKKKPLAEKILDGQAENLKAESPVLESDNFIIPEPRDFINTEQRGLAGVTNESRAIYDDTMKWLAERGCADSVPRGLVEKYAVATARWEQCDRLISMGGVTSKHPTTGAQIASPFVSMSLHWLKQANQQWHLIEAKVQEICGDDISGANRNDPMEQILNGTYKRDLSLLAANLAGKETNQK